jgi:PAP2 superfamily
MARLDQDPAPTTASSNAPTDSIVGRLVRYRRPIVAGFVLVSVVLAALLGVPERPYVLMWATVLAWLVCAGQSHPIARFVIDWLPVLVILTGYDLVRSFAPDLIPRAVTEPQLRFDEIVFGGEAPTVTLQNWLKPSNDPHVWDYFVWAFYLSHFVVTPCFATYLYVTDRARFRRYSWCLLTVCVAGFATYFILPATPPWLASRQGDLQHTVRVVQKVWASLGFAGPARVFNGAKDLANPVAALPSLHAAWPMTMLLFIWNRAPRGRWVLAAYNACMVFILVYGAEHYVSDILLGYLYAIVIFLVVNRLIDRHDARQRAAVTSPKIAS